jgi:hypothetical protein
MGARWTSDLIIPHKSGESHSFDKDTNKSCSKAGSSVFRDTASTQSDSLPILHLHKKRVSQVVATGD